MAKHSKTEPNYFLEGAKAFAKFMSTKYDPTLCDNPYKTGSVMAEQWETGWYDAEYNYQCTD